VNGKGNILIYNNNNISKLNFPLDIVSVSPTSGGINGGYPLIINGHGFPFNSSTITITLCNKLLKIT
jgi:hypothetical protein